MARVKPVKHVKRVDLSMVLALVAASIGGAMLVREIKWRSIAQVNATGKSREGDGRAAVVPEEIPAKGLRDVLWRVLHEVSEDRVTLVAGGVTFYLLLALFPALAAIVSLYGLVADPATIADNLQALSGMLPPGAFDILSVQIKSLAEKQHTGLGLTFLFGLAVALWSTHNGTLAIFDVMNVAYDEKEKRGIIKLNLLALCFTVCGMISAIAMVALVAVMPTVLSYMWLDQFKENALLLVRWPLIVALVVAAVLAVYRFGPSREPAKIRWMTWGAGLTTVGLIIMSFGLSFYLSHFANYNATYGTLGALIGFLVWTWLSVTILIIGGELNAELEHQTAMDSTTGATRPLGERGAYVADTVGQAPS